MVYLTTGEVARRCQVSVGTVKNWIEAGQLEAFRTPGGHFRIKSSALRQFQSAFGFPADPDDRPRILVVDDQREFVDLAIDSLKVLLPDARLEGAGGGYEALLRIGSLQPHVLLLDLRMPGLDGFEVCRRVKEAPASKGTRIVAMTGFVDDQAEARALACGAAAFISKSAGLATLGRRITSLLDGDAASAEVPVSRSRRASPRRARPAHPAKSARRARP